MLVFNNLISLIGRIFLSAIFIVAGFGKFADLGAAGAMFAAAGAPPSLALPVAIFEVVAGIAILIGLMTRVFALLLAVFCVLAAITAHMNFADPMQTANFLKNLAIAGGFLVLFAYGNVAHSLDAMRRRRRDVVVERHVAAPVTTTTAPVAPVGTTTTTTAAGPAVVERRSWFGGRPRV